MGIYDREYYRGETRGSAWLTGQAPGCKTIIIINVIVFFLETRLSPEFFNEVTAHSSAIFLRGHLWQLLTATFLHADIPHIGWNMLFLWIVGKEMESLYGTRDFVALYLSAAVVSTLGWAAIDFASGGHGAMLGASGAVMAVVVIYALYYPNREVLLFFVVPVTMWLLVVIYVLVDAYRLLTNTEFGVAVASHLSGAAYGYLYKHFDLRWSQLKTMSRRMQRPRLRIVTPEPREKPASRSTGPTWSPNPAASPKPTTTAVVPEELLDAKLDEILAKIARDGRGALTEEENRVLQEASRRARNRRSDRL